MVPQCARDLATWYCVELDNFDVAVLTTFDYPRGKRDNTVFGIRVKTVEDCNVAEQDSVNGGEVDEGTRSFGHQTRGVWESSLF